MDLNYFNNTGMYVLEKRGQLYLPILDSLVVRLESCSTNFGICSHLSSHRERSMSFSRLVFDLRDMVFQKN